jgi:hypothetical protein
MKRVHIVEAVALTALLTVLALLVLAAAAARTATRWFMKGKSLCLAFHHTDARS